MWLKVRMIRKAEVAGVGRHEAYYRSKVDQTILLDREGIHTPKIQIAKGELLNIEWSYKVKEQRTIIICRVTRLMGSPLTVFDRRSSGPLRESRSPSYPIVEGPRV